MPGIVANIDWRPQDVLLATCSLTAVRIARRPASTELSRKQLYDKSGVMAAWSRLLHSVQWSSCFVDAPEATSGVPRLRQQRGTLLADSVSPTNGGELMLTVGHGHRQELSDRSVAG
jgi:hypothetical protein